MIRCRTRRANFPGYSPAPNADLLLNQDVKLNALGRRRPVDQDGLIDDVRGYLRSTPKRPDVEAYLDESDVCYAAV